MLIPDTEGRKRSKLVCIEILGYTREHEMDPEEYRQKYSNMKCQRVEVDGSFVPAIQDQVMEVEHLLAEPKNDQVSEDGVLYFHEDNLGKCYDVDFSCGFEFGLSTSIGGSDSYATLNGKDDMKLEVLDGLLDDVAIDDLNTTDGLAGACEDYLLDFEFADKAVGLCGELLLQSSSFESHSPGLSGSSSGVGGVSESLKVANVQSEYKNDFLDNRVTCNICAIRTNPCQTSIGACICNSLDMQHLNELDNDPPSADSILSHETENVSVEERQAVACREKRFRKPTQRYIEEVSNLRSKEKVLNATTKNKHLSVTSHHEVHHVRLRALRKIPGKHSNGGTSDMTLPELQVCKEHLKNEVSDNGEESFAPESEDEHVTPGYRKNDRRKHQRMWTLSEVIKLVDGISEYGVGRWTDIKRLLFSSSSYRTPIDLRDKWRNLLRASSALKSNRKESEHNQEHALRPLPITVLRRIRELAKTHPYPRERCSKESCFGEAGSSAVPSRSKHSSSKRNIRRKKYM